MQRPIACVVLVFFVVVVVSVSALPMMRTKPLAIPDSSSEECKQHSYDDKNVDADPKKQLQQLQQMQLEQQKRLQTLFYEATPDHSPYLSVPMFLEPRGKAPKTTDPHPTFQGTATPSTVVTIYANGVAIAKAITTVLGRFSATPSLDMPPGTYAITAVQEEITSGMVSMPGIGPRLTILSTPASTDL